jgi:hypothetical protein
MYGFPSFSLGHLGFTYLPELLSESYFHSSLEPDCIRILNASARYLLPLSVFPFCTTNFLYYPLPLIPQWLAAAGKRENYRRFIRTPEAYPISNWALVSNNTFTPLPLPDRPRIKFPHNTKLHCLKRATAPSQIRSFFAVVRLQLVSP